MSRFRSHAGGVSLVEMMIYLALSSVVTVGVVQLFVANSTTYNMLSGQSRMQESARFALEFIGRSVRLAGYKGCYSGNPDINEVIPSGTIPYEHDVTTGILGYESIAPGTWVPAMTDLPTQATGSPYTGPPQAYQGTPMDLSVITQSTDVLVTTNISKVDHRVAVEVVNEDDVQVVVPADGLELAISDVAYIQDCEKGSIFKITDITPNPSTNPAAGSIVTIAHEMVGANDLNSTKRLPSVNTFETDATVNNIFTNIFYVAPGSGVNNLGNGTLSLYRKTGTDDAVELVEGIENLQVLFGEDTDFDNVPNRYALANNVSNFDRVVTVRVSVTANSVDDVGGTSTPTHGCTVQTCISGQTYDGLLRRTFTQTMQLRNRTGEV